MNFSPFCFMLWRNIFCSTLTMGLRYIQTNHNRTNRTKMLGLKAALLAGGEAGLFKPLPSPGRKIYYCRLVRLGLWKPSTTSTVGRYSRTSLVGRYSTTSTFGRYSTTSTEGNPLKHSSTSKVGNILQQVQ